MKQKTLVLVVCMLTGVLLAGFFGPWWAPAVFIALLSALWGIGVRQALFTGAAVLSLVYLGLATTLSVQDDADILRKTGEMLGHLSPPMLILITTFLGTITGGLAGWLGSETGRLFSPTRKNAAG